MAAAETQRATGEPVRWWHLIVPLLAIPTWIVAMVLALRPAMQYATKQGYTAQDIALFLQGPENRFVLGMLLLSMFYIVVLVVLRTVLGRVGRMRMIADFSPTPRVWILAGAVSGIVLSLGVTATIGYFATHGMDFKSNAAERELLPRSLAQLAMATAAIAIIGPYTEELYFRGALLGWLRDKMGLFLAILAGAAIFGLVHFQFIAFPGAPGWIITGLIALLGVVNGIWSYATGSLWPAFAAHAAYNATIVTMALLSAQAQT